MSEKPKLTLEMALAEFPEECRVIYPALYDWAVKRLSGHEKFRTLGVLHLLALEWLAGKEPAEWPLEENELSGFDEEAWPNDPLRWLLEEVRAQLKREKEEADAGQTKIDA